MSPTLDPLLPSLAATPSLPHDDDAVINLPVTTTVTTTVTAITRSPHTDTNGIRMQPTSSSVLSAPLATPSKAIRKSKKRTRTPDFIIFSDPPSSSSSSTSALKKLKTRTRIPLGPRSPNTLTPPPTPHTPDTPLPFSGTGSFWHDDVENQDPRPYTPPPTAPPRASTARGPGQPPPPLRSRNLPRRPAPPSAPRSMALYDLLGIADWRASEEEIVAAWRRKALESHPDRVGEEEKEAATRKMQRLNAAKEVLSDEQRKRRYDVDGVVPWGEGE